MSRRPELLAALALLLLAGVLYYPALRGEFLTYDDAMFVVDNSMVRSFDFARIFGRPDGFEYIPLTYLSLAVDWALWGKNPMGFHFTNLALFLSSAGLFATYLSRITASRWVPVIGLAFFLFHPLQVEPAAWVSGRKDLLPLFFLLLSLLCLENYFTSAFKIRWYAGAVAGFLLAAISKQSVVLFPLMVALYGPLLHGERPSLRHLRLAFPFLLISFGSVYMGLFAPRVLTPYVKVPHGGQWDSHALIQVTVFREYLANLLLPINLSAIYFMENRGDPTSADAWFSLLTFIAYLGAVVLAIFRRRNAVAFWLAWFLVILLPAMNIVPMTVAMADRYLIIPTLGIWTLAGFAFSRFLVSDRGSVRVAAAAGLSVWIALLAWGTSQRVNVWHDSEALFANAVRESPASFIANMGMGQAFDLNGKWREAESYYLRAAKLRPGAARPWNDLGAMHADRGDLVKARKYFLEALRRDPDLAVARRNLARLGVRE